MATRNQLIVGLVGQVCAGKSTVAEAFRKWGAVVYNADKAVREIYSRPETIAEVRSRFGDSVLDQRGQVDRKALAEIVFASPEKLALLTSQIIFPRTGKAIAEEIENFRKSAAPVLLLDAPTLFESGRDSVCDKIIFVAAPLERRKRWAAERGWDEGELGRRESHLKPEIEKRTRADAIIDNDGTREDVEDAVGSLLTNWGVKRKQE
jgi:dephospho-CoA kinase